MNPQVRRFLIALPFAVAVLIVLWLLLGADEPIVHGTHEVAPAGAAEVPVTQTGPVDFPARSDPDGVGRFSCTV